MKTFRLDENDAERGVTAVELVSNIRLHDRAATSLPLVTICDSDEEVAIQCQSDLNRVVSVKPRTPDVPADPNAAAFPQQHASDRPDAASAWLRRGRCARAQGRYGFNEKRRIAVSFKLRIRLLATMRSRNQSGFSTLTKSGVMP